MNRLDDERSVIDLVADEGPLAEIERGVVLVVDDEPDLRLLAEINLEGYGHTVLAAADGVDALARLRSEHVDVAVVDLQMPRMDGRTLLALMQADERLAKVPVVVVTAHGGTDGVVELLALGAHDYLAKPYVPAELVARVSAALRVRRLGDELRVRNEALSDDVVRMTRLETDLRAAEERFRVAFQNAPIAMALTGLRAGQKSALLKVNAAFIDLTGSSQETLLAGRLVDLIAAEDRAAHAAGMALLETGTVASDRIEERIVRASGEVRWGSCSTSLVTDDDGRPQYLVHQIEDITEQRLAGQRLTHRALHDSLTGLPNRQLFMDRLGQALLRAQRERTAVAVLFCDLDSFKVVNDSLGHDVGDRLLVAMGERIAKALRPSDSAARLGGDEFVVLCEGIESSAEAVAVADRLAVAISHPVTVGDTELQLTASIGVAGTFAGSTDANALLRDADTAMYSAKRGGKARSALCDGAMRHTAMERLHVETALRSGMALGELRLHYQPVVDIASHQITGVEALVRWQRPGHGLVAPVGFLEVAEDSRLIVDIGAWVLREACNQSAAWSAARPGRPLEVAVNISGHQFDRSDLADLVRRTLADTGADAGNLCLEITESVLVGATSSTLEELAELKEMGVRLAIDDFGTGFASLTYLKHFPVDTVKIDCSFVRGLGTDGDDEAIVGAVLALGHGLHLRTIAEGVETSTQLAILHDLGCEFGQGYLFARPAPAKDLSCLLTFDQSTTQRPAAAFDPFKVRATSFRTSGPQRSRRRPRS